MFGGMAQKVIEHVQRSFGLLLQADHRDRRGKALLFSRNPCIILRVDVLNRKEVPEMKLHCCKWRLLRPSSTKQVRSAVSETKVNSADAPHASKCEMVLVVYADRYRTYCQFRFWLSDHHPYPFMPEKMGKYCENHSREESQCADTGYS